MGVVISLFHYGSQPNSNRGYEPPG
ncbi:hypothetical protein OOU_Y34scaffold00346g1 [Pyricularia oryzae Y34]|uniref:Uncharacterized protein n=1 Tax=Pyricularia oryzae (strain Y34) TaxID=1143189 RepID=A0AA97P2J6_PYRO3|nr:hypothetical protein OOU_Y34scaffold00346g1 [Pyricularia oryzae Y34]